MRSIIARLVHLVGHLGDDDRLAVRRGSPRSCVLARMMTRAAARCDRPARMPLRPRMMPPVGKSGPGTISISSCDGRARGCRSARSRRRSISPRLCGGMLVAMPTAMPPAPLTSRFGKRAGRTVGSLLALVVVRLEVDRVLVDVGEQRVGDLGEPRLGVAHGRRRIAVHRAEVALPVDQRQAHREVLRHAHQRVVDRACRRAGDTCPSRRRRCGRTCGTAGRSRSRLRCIA